MTDAASMLPPWLAPALARGLSQRSHALLLHGPGPLGQLELALALAASALCETPRDDGQACGHCAACGLLSARSHPDLRVLLPDAVAVKLGWLTVEEGADGTTKSKAKPSRDIKVDAVRAAIDWSHVSSSRARAKVLVIHPAEAMNEVAANALLKTLEEPPGLLRLLLTASEPDALLPTVRSRCQRLAIGWPQAAEAAGWLEARGVKGGAELLRAAGGLPHAALALHQDGIDAATWARVPGWVRLGEASALSSWPVARVVEALHKLCHDLMHLAAGGAPLYFEPAALAPAAASTPGSQALLPMAALVAWQRDLVRAARHDEHPWHAPLRVEALVAQAAALWQTARPAVPTKGRAVATLGGR
jgi:DNA polymerase III subunit delta'